MGLPNRTIASLLAAAILSAADPSAYYSSAQSAQNSGDWKKAASIYRAGKKEYPDEIGFSTGLTWALVSLKQFREAITESETLYRRFPNDRYAHESYRNALINAGWDMQARGISNAVIYPLFETAYRIDSTNQWVMNAYGFILRETGKLDDAVRVLAAARLLYPDDAYIAGNLFWSYINLANRERDASNYTAAESHYRLAEKIDSTNESYFIHFGWFYRAQGRYPEAMTIFREGMRLYPASKWLPANLYYTALEHERSLAARGDITGAAAAAEDALVRNPHGLWMLLDCSDYHVSLRSYEKAGHYLARAAAPAAMATETLSGELSPDTLIMHRLNSIVFKYAVAKDYAPAFALIDSIAPSFPNAWFITAARGRIQYHSGRTAEGIALEYKAYDQYRSLHPECTAAVTVSPPLKGIYIVGGNSRTNAITHAGMNRYSFDFSGSDRDGNTRTKISDSAGVNADYIGFGAPIYAPVDGIVEGVEDNAVDITPTFTPVLGEGNHVWIADSAGRHYVLVHNRHRSAKVKKGDAVRTGDIVAELGNSGYSSIPHLHFAVYSKDWTVTLPVKFTAFTDVKSGRIVRAGVPGDNAVIGFSVQ